MTWQIKGGDSVAKGIAMTDKLGICLEIHIWPIEFTLACHDKLLTPFHVTGISFWWQHVMIYIYTYTYIYCGIDVGTRGVGTEVTIGGWANHTSSNTMRWVDSAGIAGALDSERERVAPLPVEVNLLHPLSWFVHLSCCCSTHSMKSGTDAGKQFRDSFLKCKVHTQ